MEGGFGKHQKGTEKEQGGEVRLTEDVPSDLNKESFCALLRWGTIFVVELIRMKLEEFKIMRCVK